jgi:hypothetical protein
MRIVLFRLARYGAISLAVVCVAGTGLGLYTAAVKRDKAAESKRAFHERLRGGVGREVKFAKSADPGDIRSAVDSLERFIQVRSGVRLGKWIKERLVDLEGRTLSGEYRPITGAELSDAISRTAMERISALNDEQISYAAECLRGFNAADLPESFRRGRNKVRLRASKAGELTPEEFTEQVRALRRADDASRSIFLGATKSAVAGEIKGRRQYLGEALPELFGAPEGGLTPMRALLITYSVASDDLLTDSEEGVRNHMRSVKEGITRQRGEWYPKPDGHFAYGPNGYLFSTPLDLVLDEQTLGILLSRIVERSAGR